MKNIKKKLDITKIKKIVNESINDVIDKFLNEGIDFDYDTLTVSYNPSHEDNVDTSIYNNPTKDSSLIENIPVWSIFKRKKGSYGDGNPLIYAMKGEKWKFKTINDELAIEKQFHLIAEKFAKLYPIGVTIIIPSSNELNHHIAEVLVSKSKNCKIIEGAICKLTTEEVNDIVLEPDSYFRRIYKSDFSEAYKQLVIYFKEMDEKKNGTFSRHLVKDNMMRDVLLNTLKLSPDRYAKDSELINGQDILIIDDTISRGQTIKEACRIMSESYAPKSITVLTLLSKLN